ncbi:MULTISPECIES: LysR family transcriptional regulator [unclassified Paludibacterium]|uniref:LysR family transcriptional regulator n=1 Tax=unclassified Paludibacterium TaxID=2618429 RepID=UPI001C03E621|nr:LysR family transcriptional regulator [Paludibacterium sp. B53371]BEV71788.1 LysR family transcriptional regulator [Paludibacterium sp. THUN1379]
MDIRQLKAFIAVYEERNISSAALRLHLSQPTLSVTIRQLEARLGTTLFLRQTRGVAISDAARQLYPRARKLVADAEALDGLFCADSEPCKLLTLGMEGEPGPAQIESILRLAHRSDPLLQLTLRQGCQGEARLAPESLRCEEELFLPLWEEPFVLVLPHDHPLASRAAIAHADLTGVDWIACPGHDSHPVLMAWYNQPEHQVPCFAAQADNFTLALSLVATGIGVALLPQSLAAGRPDLALRPLTGNAPHRRVGLCYNETARANPALAALIDQLNALPQSSSNEIGMH